ncbi:hypothetical protein B0T21DRAFT_361942 [Apiosordaria backusii]|uniref:Uncharacterized protein n=1 Tax=Apiosordaria backusii TaxID=314023 RepID=A0AA40BRK9_9PEZI|nr:hypothetical protein B0T21DRAFT_361942 [Apiosordaria backusii]
MGLFLASSTWVPQISALGSRAVTGGEKQAQHPALHFTQGKGPRGPPDGEENPRGRQPECSLRMAAAEKRDDDDNNDHDVHYPGFMCNSTLFWKTRTRQ